MALVVARRHGQPLRLRLPDGAEILVSAKPAAAPGEVKIVVEAPRAIIVERPERDAPSGPR